MVQFCRYSVFSRNGRIFLKLNGIGAVSSHIFTLSIEDDKDAVKAMAAVFRLVLYLFFANGGDRTNRQRKQHFKTSFCWVPYSTKKPEWNYNYLDFSDNQVAKKTKLEKLLFENKIWVVMQKVSLSTNYMD